MTKYNSVISRAVDIVAQKLPGMDKETVARFTRILSEEAEAISKELQYSGENVNADILAARLDGFVARLKYELRDKVYIYLYLCRLLLYSFFTKGY